MVVPDVDPTDDHVGLLGEQGVYTQLDTIGGVPRCGVNTMFAERHVRDPDGFEPGDCFADPGAFLIRHHDFDAAQRLQAVGKHLQAGGVNTVIVGEQDERQPESR